MVQGQYGLDGAQGMPACHEEYAMLHAFLHRFLESTLYVANPACQHFHFPEEDSSSEKKEWQDHYKRDGEPMAENP